MPSAAIAPRGGETLRWWIIAAAVVLVDHVTKWIASELMASRPPVVVTPFFNFVLAHNTGAAFSFLAEGSGWQRWFFAAIAVVAAVLITMLIRRHARERLFCSGLALILGGAVGNLIDRLAWGHVVDFVQLHAGAWYWPAFNVADSAITVGAVLVVLDSLRGRRAGTGKPEEASGAGGPGLK
jgi:signal peptidase II